MKVPIVRPEIWKNLYESAIKFKELAPWEILDDDEVFGVKDPLTGEIGYCCVLGALGQIFALCVYRGTEGLNLHQKIQNEELDFDQDDILALQNALMAEFSDRQELEKEDIQIIKNLGYKFRGSKAYPRFRSYLSGYCPWFLTEDEAKFLSFALRCSVDLIQRYEENPMILNPEQPGYYLVYVSQGNGGDSLPWTRQWLRPEPLKKPEAPPAPIDKGEIQKIQNTPQPSGSAWEADFFYLSAIVQDKDRPYWPRVVMVADKESGFIFFVNVTPVDVSPSLSLRDGIIASIEKHGFRPQEIHVKDETSGEVLKPLAELLGIRLRHKKTLPSILEAKMAMDKGLGKI